MSLDLDTRQRAMLREMGVHVWQPAMPQPVAEDRSQSSQNAIENIADSAIEARAGSLNDVKQVDAAHAPARLQAVPASAVPVATPVTATAALPASVAPVAVPATPPAATPAPAPRKKPAAVASPTAIIALPEGIASMAWPQLQDAVAHCQACAMCFGRRAPVLAAPDDITPCDWLVVGDPPDESQERLGMPFVEDAGVLLDNMLRAVGVQRFVPGAVPDAGPAQRAYLTHVLKCRPGLVRAPDAAELATCAHYLRREIALTQPKVILVMGRFAMQLLLSETPPESAKLPLGKLRGQVWQFAGVPVVVTYPPSYLLRSGQDKGKAWADLCLAHGVAQG